MMPDSPSHSQRSRVAPAGHKAPVSTSWAVDRYSSASSSRTRLTIGEPTRRPAKVNWIEVTDQLRDVKSAASSPIR